MSKKLDAGEFSAWLRSARQSFQTGVDADVPCGDCTACCISSQFVQISPDESEARIAIGAQFLLPSPNSPPGFAVMGYDDRGSCPMLRGGRCGIYSKRPRTCRTYDCRIFAAAGVSPSDDNENAIGKRVNKWYFSYSNDQSIVQHAATRAAAKFVNENPSCFPGNRIPTRPSDLAVLAIKVFDAFIDPETLQLIQQQDYTPQEIAARILTSFRAF